MSRKSNQPPVINIGISSLIVIFTVLCLVIFASLSLATAKNDLDNSKQLASHKQEYYKACNTSEEIISIIAENGFASADEDTVNKQLEASNIDFKVRIAGGSAAWQIKINKAQSLAVELSLSSGSYSIKQWQTVSLNQ